MPSATALPFVLRRSDDIVGVTEITSTTERVPGLLRIEDDPDKWKAVVEPVVAHMDDLMLLGALSGVEMGLELANVPHRSGGVQASRWRTLRSLRSIRHKAA